MLLFIKQVNDIKNTNFYDQDSLNKYFNSPKI